MAIFFPSFEDVFIFLIISGEKQQLQKQLKQTKIMVGRRPSYPPELELRKQSCYSTDTVLFRLSADMLEDKHATSLKFLPMSVHF